MTHTTGSVQFHHHIERFCHPTFHDSLAATKPTDRHPPTTPARPSSTPDPKTTAPNAAKPTDDSTPKLPTNDDQPDAPKPGIIAQFKDLYKRYWYVMVPVHVVTSTGWMVAFFYLSKSGVDVPELLRSIDVSDSIVGRFEQSKMGHLAIAYLCYKIATPVRYALTVGGTTVSIKYLSQWGYIKPMPSNERLKEIYADKKAQMKAGYAVMETKAKVAMSGPQKAKEETKKDGGVEESKRK